MFAKVFPYRSPQGNHFSLAACHKEAKATFPYRLPPLPFRGHKHNLSLTAMPQAVAVNVPAQQTRLAPFEVSARSPVPVSAKREAPPEIAACHTILSLLLLLSLLLSYYYNIYIYIYMFINIIIIIMISISIIVIIRIYTNT